MKKNIPLLSAVILAFFSTVLYANQHFSSVTEMVSNQKIIRVLMESNTGFGNQVSTINLTNRLSDMNFHGTFELIYPDGELDKLIMLYHLPASIPAIYAYESKNHQKITFIRESEYIRRLMQQQVEPVLLGVTGAHDAKTEEACAQNPLCKPYASNFADFTNTHVFLKLTPWTNQIGGNTSDTYYVMHEAKHHKVEPTGKYWVYPVTSFEEAKTYLTQESDGQALTKQRPALTTLIQAIESGNINFQAVYGYSVTKQYNGDGAPCEPKDFNCWVHYPQNMLQVITGARYAQIHGDNVAHKPLVIAVFYDFTKEAEEIATLINQDQWGDFEESQGGAAIREAIRQLGLRSPGVFSVASLADEKTMSKIQALQSGQILLLSMGSLPKTVFDGIYTHTAPNIWPQIREGENALSSLLKTGRPHFRCSTRFIYDEKDPNWDSHVRWELNLDFVKNPDLKSRLMNFYGKYAFCGGQIWNVDPDIYKKLGEFIIEANNPNSALSRYFSELKMDTERPENDRVIRGLEAVMRVDSGV